MRRALPLLLALPALACVEDRLSVEIMTRVDSDGSCTRRVEYRFERVDVDKDGNEVRKPLKPADDPLRLFHRFPDGPAWSVAHERLADLHTVLVEGRLATPDDADGDYFRRRTPKALPASNHVSFAMDAKAGTYDYQETFINPDSPLAGARALVARLLDKDDDFAARFEKALGPPRRAPRSLVERAYRDHFAQPLAREIARLIERPVYGPRERRALHDFLEHLDALSRDLTARLRSLLPADDATKVDKAADEAFDAIAAAIQADLEAQGLTLPAPFDDPAPIHFRATLTLPAPIVRANGCASGDTITWEFDQDDLYGRGFEMWAKAGGR